jgi:cyclase
MSKIATFSSLLGLLLLASGPASAQTDYSKVEMKTTDLGQRTYMLEGAGGNITVAVGDNGVIMVDGQFAPLHDKITAAVAAVSKEPIRYLVNTHYHGDHTGGNESFGKDGAVVTAHENVAKRLSAGTTNGLTGAKIPPAPQGAIPTRTYATEMTLQVGGREAALKHFANATPMATPTCISPMRMSWRPATS